MVLKLAAMRAATFGTLTTVGTSRPASLQPSAWIRRLPKKKAIASVKR
jgi:hypothetical protein